jgi:hypothetical protein
MTTANLDKPQEQKQKQKQKSNSPTAQTKADKQTRHQLWAIPEGLDSDLMALVTNSNQWHQMQVMPTGYDPLNVEAIANTDKAFKLRYATLQEAAAKTAKRVSAATNKSNNTNTTNPKAKSDEKSNNAKNKSKGNNDPNALVFVVRGYALAKPSFFPINSEPVGSKGIDPTQSLVQKLDLSNDSNLLAAGIEWVILPASDQWRVQGNVYLNNLEMQALQNQQVSRQSMSQSQKGGGAGKGFGFGFGGGGGGGGGAGRAAGALRKKKEAEEQHRLIEEKLKEWGEGFMVFPHIWVIGQRKAALKRHTAIENELAKYALNKTLGNRFVPLGSPTVDTDLRKLSSVVRQYPLLMPGAKTVEPNVLTSTELAALWHIPNDKFQAPGLRRAGAQSPPPAQPLISRTILPDGQVLVNNPEWRRLYGHYLMPDGSVYELGLNELSVLKHTDCTGSPGSGKSVYIENCVLQDMQRHDTGNVGKGGSPHPWNSTVMSDPNGDLTNDVLDRIPKTHELLTCVIDPLDGERVVGINPLQVPKLRPKAWAKDEEGQFDVLMDSLIPASTWRNVPLDGIVGGSGKSGLAPEPLPLRADLHQVLTDASLELRKYGADGLIAASMQEVFAKTMGVSMDTTPTIFRVLQNVIMLAVKASSNATFMTLYRLVTNENYRQAYISTVPHMDEISRVFWQEEFPQLAEKQGGAALMPTKSRLEGLLRKDPISLMFGQAHSTVNIRQMIDIGSNLFFRFSPDLSGDKPFMLAVTFNLLKQAVFSRSDVPKQQRRLVSVYLDEFQEMVGADSKTLETWLEQARKFGGAVFLAHQNLDQVEKVLKSMKGTVTNWVTMNIGPSDRKFFGDFFQTDAWPYDQIMNAFASLPKYGAVAQFQYNGQNYTPVLLHSLPQNNRQDSLIPAVIARDVPITEQTPRGYEIIPLDTYLKGENVNLNDLLQLSSKDGYQGFWEATPAATKRHLQPINALDQPQLIEELTEHLWRKNRLGWAVHPGRNAAAFKEAGLTLDDYKSDPSKVKQVQKWLIELERIPPENATRQKHFEQMGEAEWQLYRATRYHRDRQLVKYISENPTVLPEKRSRITTLSRLQWGVPIPEAKAEQTRPDKFMLMVQRGDFGGEAAEMMDEFAA